MGHLSGAARYVKGDQIGEGTFGVVFQAKDKVTDETVAVKKIRLGKAKEGVNVTALREIKLLQELKNANIITLLDVFPHKRNLHLVFEYMETDLEAVIKEKKLHLGMADIKSYLQMTLRAMEHCHANWVLHRDLKPNNLLIAPNGVLKLADFGLAKIFGSPAGRLTNQVFARWYRAPELLFGSRAYGGGVDMWAVGCIFGELILRAPLFPGNSDIDQLGKIFAVLGTPTDAQWPGMRSLPDYVEYVPCAAPPLRTHFPNASEDAISILQGLLTYDPNKRLTASGALAHPFFHNAPAPTPPALLPRPRRPELQQQRQQQQQQQQRPLAGADGVENAAGTLQEASGKDERDAAPGETSPNTMRAALALRKSFPPQPQGGGVQHHPMATVARAPQPQQRGGLGTPGGSVPMSKDGTGDRLERPQLTSTDKQYLRKRKLDLDQALEQASLSQEDIAIS